MCRQFLRLFITITSIKDAPLKNTTPPVLFWIPEKKTIFSFHLFYSIPSILFYPCHRFHSIFYLPNTQIINFKQISTTIFLSNFKICCFVSSKTTFFVSNQFQLPKIHFPYANRVTFLREKCRIEISNVKFKRITLKIFRFRYDYFYSDKINEP
jgi:hypothetical protein